MVSVFLFFWRGGCMCMVPLVVSELLLQNLLMSCNLFMQFCTLHFPKFLSSLVFRQWYSCNVPLPLSVGYDFQLFPV
jgi:hypothetical protein